MNTPIELLKALVADVEACRCTKPDEMSYGDPNACFGPFAVGVLLSQTGEHVIEWPNLALDMEQAREFLEREAKAIEAQAAQASANALTAFLDIFDKILLSDMGPTLTCIETEAFCNFFESQGRPDLAQPLREAHALGDEEGDNPAHLALKQTLESEP